MEKTTFEGIVEAGQIRLPEGIYLPDKAFVQVTIIEINETAQKTNAERIAEIEAAYGPEPDEEEKAMLRSMRRRFFRTLEPETW